MNFKKMSSEERIKYIEKDKTHDEWVELCHQIRDRWHNRYLSLQKKNNALRNINKRLRSQLEK